MALIEMSTAGLVRKPHFEEVLNAAIKDETSTHGILSVPMQRAAGNAINNPLFQRVQERLGEELADQQRTVIEQKNFENSMQRLSVEARVSHEDLKWLVENLQPPPPPPAPPPPPSASDANIDYERMAAEVDALMQRRSVETSHQNLAAEVARELSAQSMATPAQQIIREHHYHTITQPIPVPATPQTITHEVRHTGQSVHEIFLRQTEDRRRRPPDGDIDITYFAGGGGPPPAPGGGREMVRSFGPARLPRERMAPFQSNDQPPPAPGGATAPMPLQTEAPRARVESVPIRREYFPRARPKSAPGPPPTPAAEPRRPAKRKAPQQDGPLTLKPYRQPRGPGYKLGDDEPRFVPFSGRAQKLPEDGPSAAVVDAARQRMMDIARRHQQETTHRQNFQTLVENERRVRRGGARGDVVGPGKRKQPEPDERSMLRRAEAEPRRARQRVYGPGTQVYNIGN